MDKLQQSGNNGKSKTAPGQRPSAVGTSSPAESDTDLKAKLKQSASSLQRELKQEAGASRAAEQLDGRVRHGFTQRIERIATVLDDVGARLDREQEPWVVDGMHGLASRLRRTCRQVEERQLGELLDDVRGFSTTSPVAFLGGAFAVGLVAGRFLKGTRPTREHQAAPASARSREEIL